MPISPTFYHAKTTQPGLHLLVLL